MESYTKAIARKRALQQKCVRIDSDLKHVLVKWDQKKDVYAKDLFNIKARTMRFKQTLEMFGKDNVIAQSTTSLATSVTENPPYDVCTPGDPSAEERRKRHKYKPQPGGRFVPEKQREVIEAKQHEINMEMMSTGNKMRIRKAHAIVHNLGVIDVSKAEKLKKKFERKVTKDDLRKLRKNGKESRLPALPEQARRKKKALPDNRKQRLPPIR